MASVFKVNQKFLGAVLLEFTADVGRQYYVESITAKFSAAPTTAENYVVALDANAGAEFDATLYTINPQATSATSLVWYPDGWRWIVAGGDGVKVTYANTDARTIGVEITLREA